MLAALKLSHYSCRGSEPKGTQDRNRMPAISQLATEAVIPQVVHLKDSGWERGY